MIVYCYPKCQTCKRAIAYLEERKIPYEMIDIKKQPPKEEMLDSWVQQNGIPLRKFLNTSGILYKEMNLKENWEKFTYREQLSLLATHGMLIKRPICILPNKVLLGFKNKEWEDVFHA